MRMTKEPGARSDVGETRTEFSLLDRLVAVVALRALRLAALVIVPPLLVCGLKLVFFLLPIIT